MCDADISLHEIYGHMIGHNGLFCNIILNDLRYHTLFYRLDTLGRWNVVRFKI